ncbi:hypothetical protein M9Y10_026711 [Tritrichomonas musculus]|uniref:DUF3447 domain-containing protein n=1 Tax=Tritrichomonas musculus TaxID=1915356 RepID=A0ABR2H6A1_9EUKA
MKHCDAEQFPLNYFRKMKNIEENLVTFLDSQDNIDGSFNIFNDYLNNQKLSENKYEMKSFLFLIVSLSNYYHRSNNFFSKIELIIQSFREQIQNFFTIFEIFHIFQSNKRLLLFLFKSRILTPTEEIYSDIACNKKFLKRKYLEYFYPEFETYFDDNTKTKIHAMKEVDIEEFKKKREIGENDNYLCNLIRNDQIVDFISYLEQTNISPSTIIHPSIYETHLFLINKKLSLIEYSAFCGAIQIFKYLCHQKVQLETSIWPYAVHGRNVEIINFLEEQKIKTLCDTYQYLIIESIKCHHNEIAEYFQSNFCDNEKIYNNYLYRKSLKSYNFDFFTDEIVCYLINSCKNDGNLNAPFYLSKYDYFLVVEFLCKENICNIDYDYCIYKPLPEQKVNIVKYIEMKNGIFDENSEDVKERRRSKRRQKIDEYGVNEYKYDISTVLHIAILKGNIDIIQLFLSLPQIDLTSQSISYYKTCKDSDEDVFYKNSKEKSIFYEAIESGYAEVVQFLMKNACFNVNDVMTKSKSLKDYCSKGHKHYKEYYAQPLLHHAIRKRNFCIIKLLISDPNIRINEISLSDIEESGGCKQYRRWSTTIKKHTLYFAIKYMNVKIFQILIDNANIDVNLGFEEDRSKTNETKIINNKSPLYLSVENNNYEAVKLLLTKPNIDVNRESIYDNYGKILLKKTALQLAIEKKYKKIIFLLEKKII